MKSNKPKSNEIGVEEYEKSGNLDKTDVPCDYDGGIHEVKEDYYLGNKQWKLTLSPQVPIEQDDYLEYKLTYSQMNDFLIAIREDRPLELPKDGEIHIIPYGAYCKWSITLRQLK